MNSNASPQEQGAVIGIGKRRIVMIRPGPEIGAYSILLDRPMKIPRADQLQGIQRGNALKLANWNRCPGIAQNIRYHLNNPGQAFFFLN